MATALVVGNMIGSGVFLLPASLGPFGAVSLLGWVFTLTGAVLLALTFARLGRRIPRAGGPYAYTRAGLGDFPAFLVAWGYWISICASNAAIAVAGVGYLGYLWSPLATNPTAAAVVAVGSIWLLTWVNAHSVREAGAVQLGRPPSSWCRSLPSACWASPSSTRVTSRRSTRAGRRPCRP